MSEKYFLQKNNEKKIPVEEEMERLTSEDLETIKAITLNIDSVSDEMIESAMPDLLNLAQKNHSLNKFWKNSDGKINGYLICEDGDLYGEDKESTVHLKYFGTDGNLDENPIKLINEFIEKAKESKYDKAIMLGWNDRLNKVLTKFGFKRNKKNNIPNFPADFYELDLKSREEKEETKKKMIENMEEKFLQSVLKNTAKHFEKNILKDSVEETKVSMENLSIEIQKKISQNENPLTLTNIQKAILNLKIARYLQSNEPENLDINTLTDALKQTPKFLNKEKGSLERLFEIHQEKEQEIISRMRKISQIKSSFHSLLETKLGKENNEIINLFENYSKENYLINLEIFKKLKEFFRDEKISDEDKKATFSKIEEEYGIEIIPKLDLYENLFETKSGNYHLSVLRSKSHLEKESQQMNHCVGTSDSYINKMKKGEIEILSFRNKEGDPIITIEYNLKTGNIEQMKKESDEYLNFDDPYYEEFIQSLEKMQNTSTFSYNHDTGELIEGNKRKINKVNTSELGNLELEDDFMATGRGNIPTSDFDRENDFVLKTGKFTEKTSDEKLISIINKREGADYEVNEVARTPEEINENTRYFDGDLDKNHVDILQKIKGPFTLRGDANFRNCTNLTSIPENVSFGGDAYFEGCTNLTSIPENVSFGGHAHFGNCTSLTSIPENVSFGGDAYFEGCTSLTSIPENVSFGGHAHFWNCTNLTSIPENVSFGGRAHFGNCTSLTSIPENVSFGGDADFEGCTSLTSIPENVSFGGHAYFEGCTSLTSIPENVFFGGRAYFEGCTSLTSIPENVFFGGDADFRNCTALSQEEKNKLIKMKEDGLIKGELYI